MGTHKRHWRRLCGLLALALAALAGCSTVNQGAFSNYVVQTVQPGMTLDEALVRMRAEGFSCNAATGGSVMVCTRPLERLLRTDCVERVDLAPSVNAAKLLGKVDVLETRCAKLWN